VPVDISTLPATRPLHDHDLAELCSIDEQLLRKAMQSMTNTQKVTVALLPTVEKIGWHHAREAFVGLEMYGKSPEIKGAIIGDEVGKRVWCIWTRTWYNEDPTASKGNTLHILRLVIEQQELFLSHQSNAYQEGFEYVKAIAALLLAAQNQAREWNIDDVEVWNPTTATIRATQLIYPEASVVHRDGESIASLRWHGESPAPDGKKIVDHVDWIGNEKYGWC